MTLEEALERLADALNLINRAGYVVDLDGMESLDVYAPEGRPSGSVRNTLDGWKVWQ
jgi:hypothetical protein